MFMGRGGIINTKRNVKNTGGHRTVGDRLLVACERVGSRTLVTGW